MTPSLGNWIEIISVTSRTRKLGRQAAPEKRQHGCAMNPRLREKVAEARQEPASIVFFNSFTGI